MQKSMLYIMMLYATAYGAASSVTCDDSADQKAALALKGRIYSLPGGGAILRVAYNADEKKLIISARDTSDFTIPIRLVLKENCLYASDRQQLQPLSLYVEGGYPSGTKKREIGDPEVYEYLPAMRYYLMYCQNYKGKQKRHRDEFDDTTKLQKLPTLAAVMDAIKKSGQMIPLAIIDIRAWLELIYSSEEYDQLPVKRVPCGIYMRDGKIAHEQDLTRFQVRTYTSTI